MTEQTTAAPTAPLLGGGEAALDPNVFGAAVKPALHYDAVRQYRAGLRAGTHSTKTRAQVRGGGRKPWRQKGTGNARVGSRRNPLWRSGGVVFGPTPRDYSYRLNGKMQRGALRSALSLRAGEGRVRLYDEIALEAPATRTLVRRLADWNVGPGRILLVESDPSDELWLSARNLQRVELVSVAGLHTYDVLKAGVVLIRRASLEALAAKLAEAGGH